MSNLVFFFPANGPGGVQSIIIRLIEHSFYNDLPNIVVDYPDGYISNQLKKISNDLFVKHVVIVNTLDECDLLSRRFTFVAFNWQLQLAYFFQNKFETNFVYWDVHSIALNDILHLKLLGKRLKYQSPTKLLSVLTNESRVLTIDLVSKKYLEKMSNSTNIAITGIPISHSEKPEFFDIPLPQNGLHIVYIGRAVDWKVLPFYYCLKKIVSQYSHLPITCNVYTDDIEKFSECFSVDYLCFDFKVCFFEGYSVEDIIRVERNKVNLSIGMGTSQFELLTYGVPTLLIPAVTNKKTLEEFQPIWSHLLPSYIYGFDESTATVFKNIELPESISLNDSGFNWSNSDINNVREVSSSILMNYSSESVLKTLMYQASIAKSSYSNAWSLIEVKLYILWDSFIQRVKVIFS